MTPREFIYFSFFSTAMPTNSNAATTYHIQTRTRQTERERERERERGGGGQFNFKETLT
jgi:hypothetical protein